MITPAIAAKVYAAAQAQASGASAPDNISPASPTSFGEVLNGVLNQTIQASKAAESQMTAGVQGKADLVDVVTAISSAETSLQTVIAVRDQVISAYQEIMRMQI